MGAGYNYHFVTNTRLKVMLMERFRDFVSNGQLRIHSLSLVKEMATISREGDSIGAQGSSQYDDKCMAAAFAIHCWEEKIRRALIIRKASRDNETARKSRSIVDRVALFNENHLDMFFKDKQKTRVDQLRALSRQSWRGPGAASRRY
jgi:hypothetical protein